MPEIGQTISYYKIVEKPTYFETARIRSQELQLVRTIRFTDMVGRSTPRQRDEALTLVSVPQGRHRIAQRFIAGVGEAWEKVPSGRKER
jgi:hypothetical protein